MENSEGEPKKGFTVKDRRFAKQDSEESGEAESLAKGEEVREPSPELEELQAEEAREPSQEQDGPPKTEFSGLILSLANTAMLHLGVVPNPTGGNVEVNVEGARQMIDILGILEEKTQGNLTEEEDRLLKEVLAQLRMQFLGVSGSS